MWISYSFMFIIPVICQLLQLGIQTMTTGRIEDVDVMTSVALGVSVWAFVWEVAQTMLTMYARLNGHEQEMEFRKMLISSYPNLCLIHCV